MGRGEIRDGDTSVATEEESETVDGRGGSDGFLILVPMEGDVDICDKSRCINSGKRIQNWSICHETNAENQSDDDKIDD